MREKRNQAFNPYLPSYEYVPDGEPHVFENRLYVFGSHDGFNHDEYCMNDYVAYSAPLDDLSQWRFEGVIYRKMQDPSNPEGKSRMNAPDVCQGVDGRYYLYYQLHDKKFVSVAVADHPAGPYDYYGVVHHPDGEPYGCKKKDPYTFDPGILIDDGHIYLYIGFAANDGFPAVYRLYLKLSGFNMVGGCCVELEEDMLTVKSRTYELIPGQRRAKGTGFEKHAFFEASSPRKIGDRYYLVYSSHLSHELCYATSKSPIGPFSFGGTIVSIGDIGLDGIEEISQAKNYVGNTHGGLVEVGSQWYIFYHRQTNQKKCNRQGCAEKVTIREDGGIDQVEMTSCGLNPGPLIPSGSYDARIACNLRGKGPSYTYDTYKKADHSMDPYFTQSGEDRESDGDQYVANLRDGAICGFKYFDFSVEKPTRITVTVRGDARGRFLVFGEAECREAIAVIEVSMTDREVWRALTAAFQAPDSVCALFFQYKGEGALDFRAFDLQVS